MKKNILFITTRFIYPITSGRRVVLYNYCKGLSEIYNCNVDILTFLENDDEKYLNNQPKFINLKGILKQPPLLEKIKNIIIKSLIQKKWPLQVSLYYSKETQHKIDQYINKYKPDIVICDMARVAQYIINDNAEYMKILDIDDLISKRYQRQILNDDLGADAIGAYINKIPKGIRKFLDIKLIIKKILKFEQNVLEKYEFELKDYFDKYIFVSPVESTEYNQICNFKKADFVTIGVDYEYYSEQLDISKNNEIVFLGNMNVSHNKNAVDYFLKNIFPIILSKNSSVIFKIVGKCDNIEYLSKLNEYRNVITTGEVDDIRPYVKSSKASVAYLTYGSGIKTKILETMAMGIPVVTNSIGAEGILELPNRGLIVKDNNEEVAEELLRLIEDEEYNTQISNSSNQFIKNNYKWESTLKRFENILEV